MGFHLFFLFQKNRILFTEKQSFSHKFCVLLQTETNGIKHKRKNYMKRFYLLLLLAIVTNSVFAEKFNCTIEVSNVTMASADVAITPADSDAPYLYNILKADVFGENGEAGVAATLKQQMDEEIKRYAGFGSTITYNKFVSRGAVEKSFSGLTPDTKYIVYAYEVDMNTGSNASEFAIAEFTTSELTRSENVITMSYDETTRCLNITTTNDDPYFFIYETTAEYGKYYQDQTQTSLTAEVQSWVDAANQWHFLNRFVLSGNQTIDVQEFYTNNLSDLGMRTNDYIAMVAPYNGAINGDVVALEFHYDEPAIVITEEVDLHITNPTWKGVSTSESWWQVTGNSSDGKYYLSIANKESEINSGTYTLDDIETAYTMLVDISAKEQQEIRCADITVVIDAATGTIKADYTGANGVLYHITFDHIDITDPSYDNPEEVNVHIESPNWTGVAVTGSWWQVTGFSGDKMYYVTLANNYGESNVGTYHMADMDPEYTKLFEYSTGSGKLVKCKDITVVIEEDEDEAIIVKADYLGINGILYHLTFDPIGGNTGGGGSSSYDMDDQDVVATFPVDKGIVEYYAEDELLVGQYVNDNNEAFSIAFYTNSENLADGVYPINDTYTIGTVQAGDVESGYVFPTYYGIIDEEGYLEVPLFLCVEGTVTVSHNANGDMLLDVDTANTWGRTGQIKVVDGASDGIRNTSTTSLPTRKYITRKGVMIEKNGKTFNSVGQAIK